MAKFLLRLFIGILVIILTVAITLAVLFYVQRADFESQLSGKNEQITVLESEKTALQTQLQEAEDILDQAQTECFQAAESVRLIISAPCDGARLTESLAVNGMVWGIFENTVEYEIVTTEGDLIDAGFFTVAAELGVPTLFSEEIEIPGPEASGSGTLTFFSSSAMDGSRENEVEIAVAW